VTTPSTIGRYRITGELGRGGMGVVYRAVDPQLERAVAVKRISLENAGAQPASELEHRFLREARLAARLHHSAVATVFDAGRDGDALFLVMELVDGESLQRRLARGDFLTAAKSLELVAQVADALAVAHQSGIVHRDIKPANILLTPTGAVKVSDFGVAKAVGESTELTRSGTVLGSPAYMAPEQVRGAEVDGRADIFSLGVVLYELLLHRRPFPADTVTTLIYQILHQDPLDDPLALRALGSDLAVFLRQSLAKNPDERVPDATTFARRARELAAQLGSGDDLASGTTVRLSQRRPAPAAEAAPAAGRRAPLWLGAVAALTVAAVLLGAYLLLRRPPAPDVGLRPEPAVRPASPAPAVAVLPAADSQQTSKAESQQPAVTTPTAASPGPKPALQRPAVTTPPTPRSQEPRAAAPEPAAVTAPPAVVEAPPVVAAPVLPVSQVFRCREGAEFNVSPEEAVVTIDGRRLGIADDWDGKGGGKTYRFAAPGTYDVVLSLDGYRTARVQVVVSADADDKNADVDTELEERDSDR
jgi:eukaryotic-like serine/threonine-protein kinase